MNDRRQIVGGRGEQLAAAFLQARGFRLVEANWRCPLGEIDLIMERGGQFRFIEVKTRFTQTYGYPEESITKTKLRHLAHAIELWLRTQNPPPEDYQADAVAILVLPDKEPEIEWIEGIL